MELKEIRDFFDEHYADDSKPDDAVIENFFIAETSLRPRGEWIENDEGATVNTALLTAEAFRDTGTHDLVMDTLSVMEKDPHWVILGDKGTDSLKLIMKTPQVPDYYLVITDLKLAMEVATFGPSAIPRISELELVGWVPTTDHNPDEVGFQGMEEWENNNVPGCWFDKDGNDPDGEGWGHTLASKFLDDQLGFASENYLSYIIYLDADLMGNLLNWMFSFYDSLFNIISVKV